ncbi:hypothetical protein BH20ACI2_BH20ACI2_21750 [soil metagenome]
MAERIIINSGPLITLARMDALAVIDKLPHEFFVPGEVREELASGPADLLSLSFPVSIRVVELGYPRSERLFGNLDSGEAAVIQLALEQGISTVCLDERKGRLLAAKEGLTLLGSLGLLGRAKSLGLVDRIRPLIQKAQLAGVFYDVKLVDDFLRNFEE